MISIIVPFNRGNEYLTDCLESIKEQSYSDIETVLVLDGKIEECTLKLIDEYKKLINIKTYNLGNKRGVSAARNLGVKKSEGEYIYFLDSDDYLMPEALEKMMEIANGAEIVYGRIMHTWFKKAAFNIEQGDAMDDGSDKEEASKVKEVAKEQFGNAVNDRILEQKNLQGITVLGALYRKEFVVDNDLVFDEEQIYYPDSCFMIGSLIKAKNVVGCFDSIYVKRYHNDKIKLPSLSQIEDPKRIEYFEKAYIDSIECSLANCEINNHIVKIAMDYICDVYSKKFHSDKNKANNDFNSMCTIVEKSGQSAKKGRGLVDRKIINGLTKKNKETVEKWAKFKMIGNKLCTMFSSKKHLYRTINLYVFQKMKVKENWIIFESFVGRNYAGQPKYIYKYLQDNYGKKYKYIWVTDKKDMVIHGKHKKVKRFGLKYYYYMSRCKYWVNNMRQPVWFPKRKNQILLSTWHGTPLKRLVFDMDDVHSANPNYKNIVYKQTRDWDYLMSDNPFSTEVFQSCFLFDKDKIIEYGYPANDPMYYKNRDDIAKKVKEKLGIPSEKKVILYAPTWRDDKYYEAGHYKFELALDIKSMKEKFDDDYVLLLRMHYWVVDQIDMSSYENFVYDGSSYDDITELYLISDICITDYSSVFFDFANTKRPILFFTYDLEKYRDVLRGFYLDMEKDLPGPLIITNDELMDAIENIDRVTEEYSEKYKAFYDRFCCRNDGNAAKRVVEKVFK